WEAGNSLYATVNCWGRLITGVGAGLGKGDAVIVVGSVYTSEYEDRDGNRRSSLEIRATSVGPDLARCIARIEKRRHPDSATEATTSTTSTASTAENTEATEATGLEASSDDADGRADAQADTDDSTGLPMSA